MPDIQETANELASHLRELLTSIPYSYSPEHHGFKCPICKTITPLPEPKPRHTDDCIIFRAQSLLDREDGGSSSGKWQIING